MDATIKDKINRIVTCFETGTTEYNDESYGAITILQDGKIMRGAKTWQVTYGVRQTTEQGNLKALIEMYFARQDAQYRKQFEPYLSKIGTIPLYTDDNFKRLLEVAGSDKVMHEVQDSFFEQYYYKPAERWFTMNGFTKPLSMLVILDSFIQSGRIHEFLRKRFPAVPPSSGGDEKRWITEYMTTRDKWLETNPDKNLRNSDYRTDVLLREIAADNWDLKNPVVVTDGNGEIMATIP